MDNKLLLLLEEKQLAKLSLFIRKIVFPYKKLMDSWYVEQRKKKRMSKKLYEIFEKAVFLLLILMSSYVSPWK